MQGCSWSRGLLGLIFAGYVLLASKRPYPIIFYSILWPIIIDRMLVTFGQICYFRDPNLVTFYFYELTHFLDWMKNPLLFIYRTNILVRLLAVLYEELSYPNKSENVRPHSSNSVENATPL